MASRDDVVRYSVLETALRTSLGSLPRATADDARRWVQFACQCVLQEPADEVGLHAHERSNCREAFDLAQRWSRGEQVSPEKLYEVWRAACRDAETFTAKMTGPRAAVWSVLFTIEAAMHGASATRDPASLTRMAEAAESAARYARQVDTACMVEAAKFQKDLLDQMTRASPVG